MTVLSKSAFINQINSLLADNSTRQISPLDLRTSFIDLVDSLGNLVNDAELNSANFSTPDTRTTVGGEQALSEIEKAIALNAPVVVDVVTAAETRAPEAWSPAS